jgi:aminoglycoside phosphotransferase family enzyme/predicted kinase
MDHPVRSAGEPEPPSPTPGLDARRLLATCHGADPVLIETHISWVLLTGSDAYKIRRPVRLPFLDFSELSARRADCERELALNRRWAPDLYLGLVPVVGTPRSPRLGAAGAEDAAAIDWAVRMRRFPATQRLDRVAAEGGLDRELVDELAEVVATLHRQAPRAAAGSPFGTPRAITREVQGNLEYLDAWQGLADRRRFDSVRKESLELLEALGPVFRRRHNGGAVRECHGDLHLENVARVDGRLLPFDGVEFEPAFRWVDIASDLAFLLMDLHARGHPGAAHRLLDRWLQHTGDYDALRVLPHYLCYRALVRAKVGAIRAGQAGDDAGDAGAGANRLLALAERFVRPAPAPKLLLTHGVSGSGKSHLAQALVERLGAVCLRSDVERARLFSDGPGRYAPAASDSTYARLATLARLALGAGRTVIVDATFLEAPRRAPFRALARERAAAFGILALDAPRRELERRVTARAARGDDASQADAAVLAAQSRERVPLAAEERAFALEVDTGGDVDLDAVLAWVAGLT